MNQPPVLPNVEGMGLIDREIEHLLGLLGGKDVGGGADGPIGLSDLIANLELTRPNPVGIQLLMPDGLGPGLGVGLRLDLEGVLGLRRQVRSACRCLPRPALD